MIYHVDVVTPDEGASASFRVEATNPSTGADIVRELLWQREQRRWCVTRVRAATCPCCGMPCDESTHVPGWPHHVDVVSLAEAVRALTQVEGLPSLVAEVVMTYCWQCLDQKWRRRVRLAARVASVALTVTLVAGIAMAGYACAQSLNGGGR